MVPAVVACAALLSVLGPQTVVRVEVSDALGGAIRGATVEITTSAGTVTLTSDADGRVALPVTTGEHLAITVGAEGFASVRRRHTAAQADGPPMRVVLEPSPIDTFVTVTASRSLDLAERPVPSTSVLRAADLASASGITLDDALRHTPGFSLFRRSSSRVANPTTHGVTLRGLTASGASRTLVLLEGVPLNDAFGGWVGWNRVPLAAIDRVEVVRGGASDLYGPDALGGVIQVFTVSPQRAVLRALADVAGQGTARASIAGGGPLGAWQGLAAFEVASSDGYVLVAPEERGSIDEAAGGSHLGGLLRLGGKPGGWLLQGGGQVFEEDRQNGTPFQRNATASRSGQFELGRGLAGGYWRARAFGGTQGYDQTFSTVNVSRTAEVPTLAQRVPSESFGVATDWAGGTRLRALAGVEQRLVRAWNQETRYVAGVPTAPATTGGEQAFLGAYGQVAFEPAPEVSVLVGARVERWTVDSFQAERIDNETVFAPRGSIAWRLGSGFVVRGAVARSFRAPTLNERFRGFRAGNTVTTPNPLLEPERLTAAEVGASWTRGASTLRATAFLNYLGAAITNVTVSSSPGLIVRQRRNAGTVEAPGLELEGATRLYGPLTASVAATLVDSRFGDDAPAGLAGKRTPQSARGQLAAQVGWEDLPRLSVAARVLYVGPQYEDDLNTLLLERAAIVDLTASHSFARGWLAFASVENLFDEDYDVGRTPLRTIGSPRLLRVGLRMTVK